MAASMVGVQLMAQSACGLQVGDPNAALKHVLGIASEPEPPEPGVLRQYVSALSLVVDSTELND